MVNSANKSEKSGPTSEDRPRSLTRSPPESPAGSFIEGMSGERRNSLMTQEMLEKLAQRRASLDKLNVDKIKPWMHLYDFTEAEN